MDFFLQLLFTGIGIGAVYALVALGFVLIFRATSVVNFAQGEFSMVAAYLMVVFAVDLGWPYWLAFLIAIAGMALLGAVFNLAVYYPLRNRSYLPVIISTIGASIFLANTVLALYGPQPQVLPGWLDTPGFQLGPVYLDSQYLSSSPSRSRWWRSNIGSSSTRCSARNCRRRARTRKWPRCSAFPVAAMIMITFVYSAVLGGIAGILVAPVLFVSIQMGSTIALKAFAATIIGGFGDVAGAIIGGFAIGVIETFGAAYISVPYKDAFAFLVLIVFLVVPPAGHFRRAGGGEGMSDARLGDSRQIVYALAAARRRRARRDASRPTAMSPTSSCRRRPTPSPCSACRSCSACAARSISRRPRSSRSAPMPSALGTADYQPALLALPRRRRRRSRCVAGAVLGALDAAARRPLSRDGDDLVPADPDRRADQRDPLHPRPGRRQLDPARPAGFASSQAYLALAVAALGDLGLFRLAARRHAARPRDAGGARQRARRRAPAASTCSAPRSSPSRSARRSAASAAGCSPAASPTSARTSSPSPNSIVLLTMALLGGVASPIGSAIGTGLLILHSGMAALPQERAGPLSRDLRRSPSS